MRMSPALGSLLVGLSLSISSGIFAAASAETITRLVDKARGHVERHEKEAWLDSFSATGEATDPMGTPTHIGREALGHFNDALIATNTISFVDHWMLTNGLSQWRRSDVVIQNGSAETRVPAYIHYQFVAEGKELKLQNMNAYWYMPGVQLGLGAKLRRAGPMLRHLGVCKTWKFFRDGTWRTIGQSVVDESDFDVPTTDRYKLPETCEVIHITSTGERKTVDRNNFSLITYEDSIVSGYFVANKAILQLVDRASQGGEAMEGVAVVHFSKQKHMTKIEFYEGKWIVTKSGS